MGGYKRIPKEIKDEIMARLKQGEKMLQLAAENGVSTKSIYNWLSQGVKSEVSTLEYSRIRRERDDLLKIVGNLTLEVERRKKSEVIKMTQVKQMSKKDLAKKLWVSRSSIYHQPKMPARDEQVRHQIEAVLTNHHDYGHKRIALALKLNKKRILRVMKKFGIKPRRRKVRKPKKPDDIGSEPTKFPNIFQLWCPIEPGVLWASDFTYLYFQGRFFYLATLIDIFTRKIVGYHLARHHQSTLVVAALEDALSRNKAPIWVHSDQGSEYRSVIYINRCKLAGIKISMSAKSSPWHNPYQESFYDKFKVSLGFLNRFENLGELVAAIHKTMYYYNDERIHTAFKMSPVCFKETLTTNNDRLSI